MQKRPELIRLCRLGYDTGMKVAERKKQKNMQLMEYQEYFRGIYMSYWNDLTDQYLITNPIHFLVSVETPIN